MCGQMEKGGNKVGGTARVGNGDENPNGTFCINRDLARKRLTSNYEPMQYTHWHTTIAQIEQRVAKRRTQKG